MTDSQMKKNGEEDTLVQRELIRNVQKRRDLN